MGRCTHLTIEEREDIMCLRREGAGVGRIAREIGRDKSTVSREPRRNACRAGSDRPFYRASTAQRRYEERRLGCRRPRLLDDPSLRSLVQRKILEDRWSPEQVAGRIGLEAGGRAVSAATIYRAVNARELDTPGMRGTRRGMRGRLRHRGKRRCRGEEGRKGKVRVDHELAERPPGRPRGRALATGSATPSSAAAAARASSRSWTGAPATCAAAAPPRGRRRPWPTSRSPPSPACPR